MYLAMIRACLKFVIKSLFSSNVYPFKLGKSLVLSEYCNKREYNTCIGIYAYLGHRGLTVNDRVVDSISIRGNTSC